MVKSKLMREYGIIAGNFYNKYETKNPIAKYLMKRFLNSLNLLISHTNVHEIHEIGCGEGHLSINIAKRNKNVRGSDISQRIIEEAKANAQRRKIDINFKIADIYDLSPEYDAAELIVCCEVLEHLNDPDKALAVLSRLARPYLIASVPREPLWSILNLMRGKYLLDFGNTPGHINRWSKKSFLILLSKNFDIVNTFTPMPWTMVLCKTKLRQAGKGVE